MKIPIYLAILLSVFFASSAQAVQPQELLAELQEREKTASPGFAGFDVNRGKQFFSTTHGGEWSCVSCHTANPAGPGKHVVTEKVIEPLAPAANPERFSNPLKVEKWFKRNCKDVLGRECNALEKGDVLTYLLSLGG